ncbi:hypothetical protein B0H11DRAFT_2068374 [Mycena galericulata]|nr:hypothetical protein B0H11DRAFT_2073949 [Mycena galericulata]KAJ7454959.1 hypothetical protein B0H11DRAFT_2068374 [Mycena galericulata]
MVLFIATVLPLLVLLAAASPYPPQDASLWLRQDSASDPQFPASPASCGLCQQNYDSIKLCLSVVPIMANSSTIISNPGSFVDVITCACTQPFNSTFPQCVNCFEATGQTAVLNMSSPDDVVAGVTKVCEFEGALFGSKTSAAATNPVPLSGLLLSAVLLMLGSAWSQWF